MVKLFTCVLFICKVQEEMFYEKLNDMDTCCIHVHQKTFP